MALSRIFKDIPWFVSPVEVPCSPCCRKRRQNQTSALCKKCDSLVRSRSTEDEPQPLPIFKVHHEPSSIQLFYDLFFVANLSACTATHKIESSKVLGSYIGFFTLIWFTWFGTILFDVRFAVDSWFIRLSKACSLGVMALFAMTLVPFQFGEETFGHDLQKLSLILMASRLFLVIQYAVVMIAVQIRHPDRRSMWPFLATMTTSFIAAIIFLGTYWEGAPHWGGSLIIWWTTSAVEATVLLLISCQSVSMSFDQTNLVERMGALTLIIMGEGIIGMTESISSILKTSPTVSGSTIGVTIAVMLTCYFIWMLYFDHTDTVDEPGERVTKSSPRRQIWAFLHFPLHVAILMTLEGNAALMLWWVAIEAYWSLSDLVLDPLFSNITGAEALPIFERAINQFLDRYSGTTSKSQVTDIRGFLDDIGNLGSFSNESVFVEAFELTNGILNLFFDAICDSLEIAPPEMGNTTTTFTLAVIQSGLAGQQPIVQVFGVFNIWFIVLFVAAGCTLIALAVLRYVGHEEGPIWPSWFQLNRMRRRTKPSARPSKSLVALAVQVLIGIALATVSLMSLSDNIYYFITSPWIIPTVLLTYVLGKFIPVRNQYTLMSTAVITCDNILYTKYSNVHHPPIEVEQEDSHEYSKIQSEMLSPAEFPTREQPQMHERHSSTNSLLSPQLLLNDHELDTISLARTEDSRMYRDEENAIVEEAYGP
jgi:low temperature requirement protein LtrA